MILLIAGASHTGKTLLAQRLLERYHWPYLSIDHLKMGLIRSKNTDLTPMDDDKLTAYLWPIVREMIKTAIENGQDLIVEGCYIPFDWKKDLEPRYLEQIRYRCLILSKCYIENRFGDIQRYGSVIEQRLDDSGLCKEELLRENEENLRQCKRYGCDYILIDNRYAIDLDAVTAKHLVRDVDIEDMERAAHIMVTSFRTAFAPFVSRQTMDACTVPENCRELLRQVYRNENMHFLIGGGQGFLCWQDNPDSAEIMAIHSLPESWGSGLGKAMLTEALRRIGDKTVFLWAFKENSRARRFYEKQGFSWDGSERVSEFDGALEVRYVKAPV